MIDKLLTAYKEALFDTDRERALVVVHAALQEGFAPEDILFKLVLPTVLEFEKAVGEGFEINLAQQFMSSQIALEITDEMISKFKKRPVAAGHIVIGTAEGDLHSLGKRIVAGCLTALMIDVTDLGVNVEPECFVAEALAHDAQVIGISAMMVHTARGENGCRKVRQLLKEGGLEEKIKIIVGGAPYCFDHNLYKTVQADAWAANGIAAGSVITELIKEVRR
ncbi:cobalamin B12-binding domain protein [Candidatus Vecturithrix granuli]|uniref:Cobalamin B12-binding domain protein n=1 Tax=Vecturithrix granuli TaxID=1499967 RepID=A0A0S6WBB8_VECG1|nr:cobalamin B12-binding domain protein [Candidatus Vecturithrix granuli]